MGTLAPASGHGASILAGAASEVDSGALAKRSLDLVPPTARSPIFLVRTSLPAALFAGLATGLATSRGEAESP